MTSVNGVHALLALLVQQSQAMKVMGKGVVDVKQLELLLQESQLLNERLLRIEKAVAALSPRDREDLSRAVVAPGRVEGNWPAASVVQDSINRQERQQAFGHWLAHETVILDSEAFSHQEVYSKSEIEDANTHQIPTQKYVPTDVEIMTSHPSANYGLHVRSSHYQEWINADNEHIQANQLSSRVILIAIGISFLLLSIFVAFG